MSYPEPSNFIEEVVISDLTSGKWTHVQTRFPPEPNGYLHIGHAKSICLNFGLAKKYGGQCNLRFDDTNPSKEETEYVDSIMDDIKWLGFEWSELHYASDYFQQLYDFAVHMIKEGKAYVCDLSADEMRAYRGTLTEAGRNSPYRDRSIDENLDLFERMRRGEFDEGAHILRAKIDMASPNMNLRDPAMYRIMKVPHHRTGDTWCIYPMYDFTHGINDALEQITHSICTLEFEDHRPLYDWFLRQIPVPCYPQQIEFARLNLTYTVMSKRKLLQLVMSGSVNGWDDPRMPTIAGMRRRGYPPEALRAFAEKIGVAKMFSTIDIELLLFCVREQLNKTAQRVMVVLRPIKLVIDNYPDDQVEWLEADNNPEDPEAGKRQIPFCKELYIEADDFKENPPPKYFRLSIGKEIRLKHAYYITAHSVEKDDCGHVATIHCNYDPQSRGGWSQDGRKVMGTSHWVSAKHALEAEVRIYDHLFTKQNPEDVPDGHDFMEGFNLQSIETLTGCKAEPSLAEKTVGERFQFLRQGYFCVDNDSQKDKLVFNQTVTLKDAWAKIEKKN